MEKPELTLHHCMLNHSLYEPCIARLQVSASLVNVYLRPNLSGKFQDASSSAALNGQGALPDASMALIRDKVKLPPHHPSVTILRDNQTASQLYQQQHCAGFSKYRAAETAALAAVGASQHVLSCTIRDDCPVAKRESTGIVSRRKQQ